MNSTELSNFILSEKKEKVNMNFDWNILDKAKAYMLSLTEQYHIFSNKC